MADTVLKSIAIRNWTQVRNAEITFPERGLVLVRGINAAARGKMASIGAGKTALGEAISRTLFGVRGRFTHLGNFSSGSKGNSYVKVVCEHKGKPLTVEMGFKCEELSKVGEGLKYTYDGVEVCRDTVDHTRADLLKLLTVPTDLASWTVYLDGDKLHFYDLAEKKAVELLMAALQQTGWNTAHRQANSVVLTTENELAKHKSALAQARSAKDEVELELKVAKQNLADAEKAYSEAAASVKKELNEAKAKLKQLTTKLSQTRERMAEIKKEIDHRIKANASREHGLEIVVNEKQDILDALREEQAKLRTEQAERAAELRQANASKAQAEAKPESCPTCGQPVPGPDPKAIAQLRKQAEAAQKAQTAAATAVAKKTKEIEAAANAVQAARKALQEAKAEAPITGLSTEYEELEGEVGSVNSAIAFTERSKIKLEAGPDKTSVTRYSAVVTERKKHFSKASENVNAAALNVTETEEALRVASYWQEAFSPTGIPNLVLREALPPLNSTAKRISTMLTGGSITVSYDTSRELASGKGTRSELVIKVKNDLGSGRFEGSSKGESGLTELIVAETLAEVGGIAQRIGYRWYDEVCPNQDELVRRSIFAYLSELAQRHGILVFVISHAPEASSYANYVLIAEKTKEGTTYRWENR